MGVSAGIIDDYFAQVIFFMGPRAISLQNEKLETTNWIGFELLLKC